MKVKMYQKIINGVCRNEEENTFGYVLPIQKVEKKFIKEFETSNIPEIGEIIYFEEDNKAYKVVKKIRMLNCFSEAHFVLEVILYTGYHHYSVGSSGEIPLVVDIKD